MCPPKLPSPATELVPSCKGPGLVPRPQPDPVGIPGSVCFGHFWAQALRNPIGFRAVPCPRAHTVCNPNTSGKIYDLEKKIGKDKKKHSQAPFPWVFTQLRGNFPPDGKLWKSRVGARRSVSLFSPQRGHACGVRTVRGTGMGMQKGMVCTRDAGRDGDARRDGAGNAGRDGDGDAGSNRDAGGDGDGDGDAGRNRDAGGDGDAGRDEHLAACSLLHPCKQWQSQTCRRSPSALGTVQAAGAGALTWASCHAVPRLLRLVPTPSGCCVESRGLGPSTWAVAALQT